jgi:hypothetical protein
MGTQQDTRSVYAQAVLAGLIGHYGWRHLGARRGLVTWSIAECGSGRIDGSHDQGAAFNLCGTTLAFGTGWTNYNSIGVKNFPDVQTGIDAMVATLQESRYDALRTVLVKPFVRASTVAAAVDASPWGTTNAVDMLSTYQHNRAFYDNLLVG